MKKIFLDASCFESDFEINITHGKQSTELWSPVNTTQKGDEPAGIIEASKS